MLTTADPRFFGPELRQRLGNVLARRQLFPPELLALADRAAYEAELPDAAAERFLDLAVGAFELSTEPVDRAWYETLERVSAVAADIGGVGSTHVNHLTPRVLDIDELYRRMTDRGVAMIDAIQGPPRLDVDVLLRKTSFRALAENPAMREPDGTIGQGALRVRFGEVEARGTALTPAGRARYDALVTSGPAPEVWRDGLPRTERGFLDEGLAYFTYHRVRPAGGSLADQLDRGAVRAGPIVYENFLPRSAAGIFQSNLSDAGTRDDHQQATHYDADRLAGVLDRDVHDPFVLYEREQNTSITALSITALEAPR